MDPAQPPSPLQESTDIFSLSDQVLSDSLQFIEEIGFGNWGSVWLCRPKPSGADRLTNVPDQKIAVKLVHRSKTSTTAARVRSLWNEMKIIKTFKSDPHPSIIPFHSFIITPSYALITMAYLPTLVPVEVDETKARDWFRFLLSGIDFLHRRGVVHNDIKPANILLSTKNVPVLVDFGFAEKYDIKSSTAFHSNLSYGTPEYLSPERARGLPHDTRKADIWSLGVTFFEILMGRTPFEQSDGEQFTNKEDLEKYWSRTLRGKWIGSWKMSKGMERMLRRMVAPNADLRCTAPQAMADPFWDYRRSSVTAHRRSSSYTSSVVFEKDISKLALPWKENECPPTPPGLCPVDGKPPKERLPVPQLTKVKSQPKVVVPKVQQRKRGPIPALADLSPIKGSRTSSLVASPGGKENVKPLNAIASPIAATRRPFGALTGRDNMPQPQMRMMPNPSTEGGKDKDRRRSRVLADLTGNNNIERVKEGGTGGVKEKEGKKDHVRERVREWEREKERLREMARLEEIEKERDDRVEEEGRGREMAERRARMEATPEKVKEQDKESASDKENHRVTLSPAVTSPTTSTFMTESEADAEPRESPVRSPNGSSLSVFRHNIRRSIDKTVRMYKTSAIAQLTGRTTPAKELSFDAGDDDTRSRRSHSERESWEDEALLREANSSLPVVRHAVHNERVAADAKMDRMTIWMRNVEKVVEDAQQNFASTSTHHLVPLPPLPLAPVSRSASNTRDTVRSNRSSRLPRRVLAASQIFTDDTADYTANSTGAYATVNTTTTTDDAVPSEGPSRVLPAIEIHTPSRQRRATVSGLSPESPLKLDLDLGSPSKRREKSKSHGNLFQRHIAPISFLEAELNKADAPPASPRLSEVLDSSLFIAPPKSARSLDFSMQRISVIKPQESLNDLTSSPFHVEPYPVRKSTSEIPDSPYQRRVEGVYDRFLMATSGVKRLGKGYQSDNVGPMANTVGHIAGAGGQAGKRDSHRAFYTAKRPMPPPVSSEDVQKKTMSVDELGIIKVTPVDRESTPPTAVPKDEINAGSLIKRIKAMVPGKPVSKRLSRLPG